MITILNKIKRRLISICISFFINSDNRILFNNVYKEALEIYTREKASFDYKKFVIAKWEENTNNIEDFFVNSFSFSFLRNQVLKRTMFFHLPKITTELQKNLLKEQFEPAHLKTIIKEHSVGAPILNDFELATSGNSIHHLYHLAKFKKETGIDTEKVNHVLEFGGGYGNFAKLVRKIKPQITYTIIDIPVFSFIQFVYLSTIFGRDSVVIYNPQIGLVTGKINIVPFHESNIRGLAFVTTGKPDIFVSTWALSESNDETQSLIQELNYFNAQYLLLAYQKANKEFVYAENIVHHIPNHKVIYNEETEYLDNNYYLFASKKP